MRHFHESGEGAVTPVENAAFTFVALAVSTTYLTQNVVVPALLGDAGAGDDSNDDYDGAPHNGKSDIRWNGHVPWIPSALSCPSDELSVCCSNERAKLASRTGQVR